MSDPHWSNVVFLSGFEGGTIIDESPLAQTVTVSGSAAATSAQAKYGTQSLYRPNVASSYVSVPDHASMAFGSGSFTLECEVMLASASTRTWQILMAQWDNTGGQYAWRLRYDDQNNLLQFAWSSGGSTSQTIKSVTLAASTWYTLCWEYESSTGTFRVYVDGVTLHSEVWGAISIDNATCPLSIGSAISDSTTPDFDGYLDEVRITAGVARYASDVGYTVEGAAYSRTGANEAVITEGLALSGESGLGDTYNETLTQGVGVAQAQVSALRVYRLLSDTIGVSERLERVYRQTVALTETVGMAQAQIDYRGVVMRDVLWMSLTQVTNNNSQLSLAEELELDATLRNAVEVVLTQGLGVAPTQLVIRAVQVIEALRMAPTLAATAIYGRTVAETIRVSDALARFFGGDVLEGLGMTSVLSGQLSAQGALSEGIGVAEAVAHQLVLRVTAAETIGIDDANVLQMLFAPELAEGVEISAAYISPGGGFTTWAMNTRTAAVSEYDNFAFNSFAPIGNKYIGASSEGLYELNGDTDDGADIIARIKSGFAQFAGTRHTLFKEAYLGVRGEGDFVLRIISGEGQTYDYAVSTRDMRSTKVHLGKGLRARYFAFELISTGQDFDLDTIEFLPLVAQRRV